MKAKEHAGFFHGNHTRYPYIVYGLFPLPPPPPRYTKKNPPIGDCIISSFIIKHKTYTIYYYLWNTEIHKTFPLLLLLSCLKYNICVITIFNNNAGLLDCCKDVLNYMFSLWIIRYTERNNNKVWNRLLKLKKI